MKKVVKAVVEEEDRSKNIMLFGLDEEKNETLSNKVDEVLVSVGEKPSSVASRVSKKSSEGQKSHSEEQWLGKSVVSESKKITDS